MPDERNRLDEKKQGSTQQQQQQYSSQGDRQSPLDDLEAGADDIEKVKGGRRIAADPCEGGE